MRYLPVAYFPASYFGGAEQAAGSAVSMAAALTGSGVLVGEVQASAALAIDLDGSGEFQGQLATSSRQSILGGGGFTRRRRRRKEPEQHVLVDLAVLSCGTGTLAGQLVATSRAGAAIDAHSRMRGRLSAAVEIGLNAIGSGEMSATPVVDITSLLKRRREEEAIAWLLVG